MTFLNIYHQHSLDHKTFAVSLKNLKTIYETKFLQVTKNDVEEFKQFEENYSKLKFSTSLIRLHLELPLFNSNILPKLLKLFTDQLKSLTLIIRTTNTVVSILKNELENMITDPAPVSFTDILRSDFEGGNHSTRHF